jgi:rhamnulokinase
MTPTRYLALDIGAESGRAIVGTLDGGALAFVEVARFPNQPIHLPQDGLHWDILRLWHEVEDSIRQSLQRYGPLASLGLDTWGVDFGLLDRDGRLIANPTHYRDNRTDGMLDEAFRRLPREQIFEYTGIQFMQINTLYQLLAMAVNRSPALAAAETFLTIPDLFNYWLTGRKVCEFTNATTTQCYDPRARAWAGPVLEALGIPGRIFPEVVSPGTVLGPLQHPSAGALGDTAWVIAPACHDTGSAVAAIPAQTESFAWISSGTWSVMGVNVPEAIITPQSFEFNLTNEGGLNGSFRCSKNVMGLWLVQECRRTWAAHGTEWSYTQLTQLAAQADPLVSIVDPDSGDFLKPGDMPARLGEFCRRTGQPVPGSPGAFVRCALESMALKYRWVLEKLETVSGQTLDPIHIIGGGSQNELLNQLTADCTGRTVVAGPAEATAIGNLLVQAVALGHIDLAEARAVVRRSFQPATYAPNPAADWESAYRRLLALL